jgi:NADH dehydrogenase [ubiquinone] 1 alpha subcomplex assembly factor 6
MVDQTFEGRPVEHPISIALAEALQDFKLTKSWFKRVLTSRERLLNQPTFATMDALETYGENTASSLLYLHLESLGAHSHGAEHAAGHLGKALGIATVLRGLPFQLEKRNLCLPSQIMAKHSLSAEEIFRSGPSINFSDAVYEIATRANDQLLTARSFSKDVPKEAIPALLAAVLSTNVGATTILFIASREK